MKSERCGTPSLDRARAPHSPIAGKATIWLGKTDAMHIESVAIIVNDYDTAIEFFVDVLGFELVEDSPATTNDGRPKRWVVVRPPGATTGLLLARADGDRQRRGGRRPDGGTGRLLPPRRRLRRRVSTDGRQGRRVRDDSTEPSRTAPTPSSSTSPATSGISSALDPSLSRCDRGLARDRRRGRWPTRCRPTAGPASRAPAAVSRPPTRASSGPGARSGSRPRRAIRRA